MTLAERLQQAESQLRTSPHPERADKDAEALLLHVIGRNNAWLLAHSNDEFGGCTAISYASLVDRRRKGEPIQYITGETEFYGLPFRVTPDVLIPRPETEHLVEKVVELLPLFRRPRVVDVGTGSGAIAIALAHEWPAASVTAIDLSAAALELACRNAKRIGFANRIRFLQGDLLAPVAGEQFDFIVSNPPYVPNSDRDTLAVEVRDHEPSLALFAGNDGLDIYRRLIPAAFASLVPSGFIALEIGYGQQPAIHDLLASAGFQRIEFHPDLQNIPRVVIAQHP
jgi:release factor glutamine methyltransferase